MTSLLAFVDSATRNVAVAVAASGKSTRPFSTLSCQAATNGRSARDQVPLLERVKKATVLQSPVGGFVISPSAGSGLVIGQAAISASAARRLSEPSVRVTFAVDSSAMGMSARS